MCVVGPDLACLLSSPMDVVLGVLLVLLVLALVGLTIRTLQREFEVFGRSIKALFRRCLSGGSRIMGDPKFRVHDHIVTFNLAFLN